MTEPTARYFPQIFDVSDMRQARQMILTTEGPGADTDSRWEKETPYLMELIRQSVDLRPGMVVLDYGCGIGRLAKLMIETAGCAVIGVDISPSMRRLALDYVGSDRLIVASPAQFDVMCSAGLRVDAAIAVWVLQHCLTPAADIARIRLSLKANGSLFVLNMPKRAIPAVADTANGRFVWAQDEVDVAALLRSDFLVEAEGTPDRSRTPNMADVGAFWMHCIRAVDNSD